jgi:hypothetical protein
MRVVVLGAGASTGFDSLRPAWEKPPTTGRLLDRGRSLGILDEPLYEDLIKGLREYARVRGLTPETEKGADVEEFLGWVAQEFEKESEAGPPWKRQARPFDAQAALGQSIYYIYEVLRGSIGTYEPRADAYSRLARSFRRDPFNVVSLNYDTLFDIAVARTIGAIAYAPPVPPGALPMAKLHGSINWLSPFNQAITVRGGGPSFDPRSVIRFIWSNRFQSEEFYILPPDWPRTHSVRDIVPNGERYFEPAIVPPVGSAKDFEKITFFRKTVAFASAMMAAADELVLIGTSLRGQDHVLCDLVKTALANKPKVVAVGNLATLRERLLSIDPSVEASALTHFPAFEDYANEL